MTKHANVDSIRHQVSGRSPGKNGVYFLPRSVRGGIGVESLDALWKMEKVELEALIEGALGKRTSKSVYCNGRGHVKADCSRLLVASGSRRPQSRGSH